MEDGPAWLPIAIVGGFLLVFPLFWMTILRLIAFMGWDALAARYRFDGPSPKGFQRFGAASLSVGRSLWLGPNYENCAIIVLRPEALYIRMWRIFSFGHPPLKIGWNDIEAIETRRLFLASARILRLARVDRSLLLRGRPGEEVEKSWRKATGQGKMA